MKATMRLTLTELLVRPLLLLIALTLAVMGQLTLRDNVRAGLLLYALALGALWSSGAFALVRGVGEIRRGAHVTVRLRPLMLALLLALVAWMQSGDGVFTFLGVLSWWGSVILWLYAWWPQAASAARGSTTGPSVRQFMPSVKQNVLRVSPATFSSGLAPELPAALRVRLAAVRNRVGFWPLAPLVLILLVAAFFRFYDLQHLPPEMTSDHAEKLYDVRDVLMGQRPIFFPRNTGREPMQFYLTALLAGPLGFGLSHMALKVGTSIISWITIPLMYTAARYGAGTPRTVALIAAALLAVSKWHTSITRVGLRFPYAPFAAALTLVFLMRAVRTNDRRAWLLTGLTLGVGLYGYTASRIIPVVVVVAIAIWWIVGVWRRGASPVAALVDSLLVPATTALVFLPLGHYSQQHPDQFWYRSMTRIAEGTPTSDLWRVFWHNAWNAARMFHWRGDVVWVNTLPNDPALDSVTGALFLLGLGFLLVRIVRERRLVDILILVALPILVLPSILALGWPDENPSVVRAGGALPVVMLISAWPLALLAHAITNAVRSRGGQAVATIVVVAVIGVAAVLNWRTYSGPYRQNYEQSSWNTTEAGDVISEWAPVIGGTQHAYVKSWPHWFDHRAIAFNIGNPDWNNVIMDLNEIEARAPEVRLLLVNPQDTEAINALQQQWAGGQLYLFESRVPTREFWVFVRPGYAR